MLWTLVIGACTATDDLPLPGGGPGAVADAGPPDGPAPETCLVAAPGLALPLRTVTVFGTITVHGAATTKGGRLFLHDATTNDDVPLGFVSAGTFSVTVAAKRYDLYFAGGAAGDVAANTRARVRTGIDATADVRVDIDLRPAVVSGTVLIQGQPRPDPGRWFLALENTATRDRVLLSNGATNYDATVFAGDYGVYYGCNACKLTDTFPHNTRARLFSATVRDMATRIDVNVPVSTVSGQFTHNGGEVPSSGLGGSPRVVLEDSDGAVTLGEVKPFLAPYSVPIIPGTYSVWYRGGSSTIPINTHARLRTDAVPIVGAVTLDVDIPAATVMSNTMGFELVAGDDVAFTTNSTSFSVVPGTYDVVSPLFGTLRTDVAVVRPSTQIDFAIATRDIRGKVTFNGAPPRTGAGWGLALRARGGRTYVPLYVSETTGAYYLLNRLRPGPYDLIYTHAGASGFPANKGVIRTLTIGPNDAIDIDIPVAAVAIAVTPAADHTFTLRRDGDEATLIADTAGRITGWLIPGRYDLYLTQAAGGPPPRNSNLKVGCIVVPAR